MIATFMFLLGLVLGVAAGVLYFKKVTERRLEEAGKTAEHILQEARKEAQNIKKAAEVQAKDYWFKQKRKFERETQEQRRSLEAQARKLEAQKGQLEKRSEALARKERELQTRERELKQRERALQRQEEHLEKLVAEQVHRLEEVARLTREEARQELLRAVETQVRYEAAQLAHKIREEAKQNAEREARQIIAMAIQRCAANHTAETTVTVVSLPSDDMKGRIIGREGRNIRAFEQLTGVEVIIDDTPEAITLSSFDPVRREIARLAMERLLKDGRIHPARIEEVVLQVQKEFENYKRMVGEETALELGITGLHPELLSLVGSMKYRTSYGQNLLLHSKEVAYLCGLMAGELGLDAQIAKRAGLLHDIGKVADPNLEGPHALVGAQLAKRYGENDLVVNAIAAHHEDVPPKSPYAFLVAAADAISGARPGARRESLEAYIRRIEKLEEIATSYRGVEKAFAIQAGRELRILVESEKVSDAEALDLAHQIARRIEEEVQYPGQIKVTVIRETRAVEYAR